MSRQQIDFPVQQHHITTPPPPPAGSLKLYPKSDNVLYKLTSAGVESAVGVIPDPLVVNNATVNQVLTVGGTGKIQIGTAGVPPPFLRPQGVGSYQLESPAEYGMLSSYLGTHVSGNLYWDGVGWMRYVTASSGQMVVAAPGQTTFYRTGAGANPAGLSTSGIINAEGSWTVGGSNVTTALVVNGWITSNDGTNGVIKAGAGDLYLRPVGGSNVVRMDTGTVNIANALSVGGAVTSGGHLTAASTMGVAGKATFTGNGAGYVISNASGQANVEIQSNPGTGAAMIGFHRPGYYAVNFGLDTDNYLKVGGWSMGGVAHRLVDMSQVSAAAGGSTIVQRNGSGYIYANYVNLTADIQGGAPTYVAGQNGDGFLRWYPKSLVGPKPLWYSHPGINQGTSGTQAVGSTVTVPYTGYYFVSAWLKTSTAGSNQWYVRLDIPGYGTVVNGASDWLEGNGRHWRVCDWLGVMSAGQSIYAVSVLLGGTAGSISITGNLYVNFMPTDGYPG